MDKEKIIHIEITDKEGFRKHYKSGEYGEPFIGYHIEKPGTKEHRGLLYKHGGLSLEMLKDEHLLFIAPDLSWCLSCLNESIEGQTEVYKVEFDIKLAVVTDIFCLYRSSFFKFQGDAAKTIKERYALSALAGTLTALGVDAFFYTGKDGEFAELFLTKPHKSIVRIEKIISMETF
jgi:hypothetical protein